MGKQKGHEIAKKVEKTLRISMKEIRKGVRIPLPVKTGGRHNDLRKVSRQEQKIALRKAF